MNTNQYKKEVKTLDEKKAYILYMIIGVILICFGGYNFYLTSKAEFLVAILMGIIMLVQGGSRSGHLQKVENEKKQVAQSGRCIYATITSIEESWDMDKRYITGTVLKCEYMDEMTEMKHFFTSEPMTDIPGYAFSIGDPVRVYVEGNNYIKYYVDVENSVKRKIVDCT